MASRKKALWSGRFSEEPDEFLMEFGSSIDVDIELLEYDIRGSIAWALALGKANLLTLQEVEDITDGLQHVEENLKAQLDAGKARFDRSLEDVHMTVEAELTGLIGETGAKLHTGRSRNDQVALDERQYVLAAADDTVGLLERVQGAIIGRAGEHVDSVVPSYTHLQQAQPIRLGHYLMSWFWMLDRDKGRFLDAKSRADVLPLGAGAVAGSGFAVDRHFLAEKLGFSKISENSIDAVSDRDYIIETIAASAVLMMHLSRIAEDLIIWSTAEFGFVSIPEKYTTGSSMMPQKKNPDSLELVRGKTGRVYGSLMTILTVLKGLPLSYGKDMQEDKEPLFDALKTVRQCLIILEGVIGGIVFDTERMKSVLDDSVFATDIADYLTKKGIPFRQAHETTGKLVKWKTLHSVPFSGIPLDIYTKHSAAFDTDVYELFDLERSADNRSLPGGTGKQALLRQIAAAKKRIIHKD